MPQPASAQRPSTLDSENQHVWQPTNEIDRKHSTPDSILENRLNDNAAQRDDASARAAYDRDGFIRIENAIDPEILDRLEQNFLTLVEQYGGPHFGSATTPEFASWLSENREMERQLYDGIRKPNWLTEFSLHTSITQHIRSLLGDHFGLLEKIPFRIDLPMVMRELAVWHQDHFYVRGNTDIVTAWIPLQNTNYENGCLLVMPGSHKLGSIPHDKPLLQKKSIPSRIFERPVRYVEMQRGDLLLFNSLLLHSSGMNISDRIRYSVQARYSPTNLPTDPSMGNLIQV